ncbi:MAG: PepSY domain-containing protein [Oxalobacteraceae bacterium]
MNPGQNTSGNTVLDCLHPLHNGEAFGLAGRWMILFLCFVPLFLLVTGFIRWRQKRRAKRFLAARI